MTMTDKPASVEKPPESIRRRSASPQIVAGAVLVLIGALWLLERLGWLDLTVTTVLAIGTIVIGVALMILSGDGPHSGLIVFGTIVALIATLTAAAPLEGFQGGVGERVVQVIRAQDLEPDYNLAMGNLTIDLSDLGSLETVQSFKANVGMGELRIRVPEGVAVSIDASAGAGDIQLFDRSSNGLGVDLSYQTDGFGSAREGLVIQAEVFMGRVEVTNG